MNIKNQILVVLAIATTSSCATPVYADAISPRIKDRGNVYSKEPANSSFYGTGIGGRAVEAMNLRFEVERMLQDANLDDAVSKAKKACQLDPSDPTCHILLARGLTRRFYAKEGPIDEKLLKECLDEWKLLWFHDSDQWEQMEAKQEARRLMKIAKNLQKQKDTEAKERLAAKVAAAKAAHQSDKPAAQTIANAGSNVQEKKDQSEGTSGQSESEAIKVASKKKRFVLF